MRQEFWIETVPIAQARPRFARMGNFVKTYDPAKSKEYKSDIKWQVLQQPHEMMPDGPLTMIMEFYLMRPKTHYGKNGVKKNAPYWHTKKPDLDNLIKAVKDALTGIVYRDDGQICFETANKRYADVPGIRIVIQDTV